MATLFLTPEEVAELLRVAESDVTSLISRGELAALQVAGNWRITADSLTEYIASGLRNQNVKALESALINPSCWTRLLGEMPELRSQVEREVYPPGSMGEFMQKALAVERAANEGKVVPLRSGKSPSDAA